MKKNLTVLSVLSVLSVMTSNFTYAAVNPTNTSDMYLGGGLQHVVSTERDSMPGVRFNVFLGYRLNELLKLGKTFDFSLEIGSQYIITEDNSLYVSAGMATGLVVSYQFMDKVKAIGRLGYDTGDEDIDNLSSDNFSSYGRDFGWLYSFGAEYSFDSQISLRAEYVLFPDNNALQINAKYKF